MSIATSLIVYALIWWVVLFAVLPLGVRTPDTPEPGHDPGAPVAAWLWRKFAITTVMSAVIWAGFYALQQSGLISFRDMARQMRE